ncbi:hypothetical protein BGZ95_010251 [Linnemannia exigua]|uniref:Uncharacterized protein n=1 Tax=Linnemannia exigua TaxID=604196 RepID=A0AAD4DBX5_9FUNG|nr:hypothetical protein BGZ95_010251 [Linnemannia exigua]
MGMSDRAAGVGLETTTCLDSKHYRHFFEIDLFRAYLHGILDEIHISEDGETPFDRIVDAIMEYACYPGALSANYMSYNNAMFCTKRRPFIDLLFGYYGNYDKEVSTISDDRSTRYKFRSSMQPNGLVVNRLA